MYQLVKLGDEKRKKVAPTKKATPQITNTNITKLKIKSPIEKRLVERLLKSPCARKKLDQICGTVNSPEYVRRLRDQGLGITTQRAYGWNRDHRRIWWGIYALPASEQTKALEALEACS